MSTGLSIFGTPASRNSTPLTGCRPEICTVFSTGRKPNRRAFSDTCPGPTGVNRNLPSSSVETETPSPALTIAPITGAPAESTTTPLTTDCALRMLGVRHTTTPPANSGRPRNLCESRAVMRVTLPAGRRNIPALPAAEPDLYQLRPKKQPFVQGTERTRALQEKPVARSQTLQHRTTGRPYGSPVSFSRFPGPRSAAVHGTDRRDPTSQAG
jgi:hypothetical protein